MKSPKKKFENWVSRYVAQKPAVVVTPDRSSNTVLAFVWNPERLSQFDIYDKLIRMGYPLTIQIREASTREKAEEAVAILGSVVVLVLTFASLVLSFGVLEQIL